jgi:ABC-type transport system involved in multi-copper enzyme maturation permease subunit
VRDLLQLIAAPFGISRLSLTLPALVSPSFYIIVISLLAALFIGEERSQNMWKTTLVAQPSRLAVLFGKFIVAMLLLFVYLLGAYLSGLVFGAVGTLFLPTDFAGEWLELAGLYGLQWLYAIGGMSFAFLMIWLLRNQALGLVSVFFLPALLEGLYTIYATVVGFQPLNRLNAIFQALRLRQTLEDLPRYFFTSNLYAPARQPVRELISLLGEAPSGPENDFGPFANILGSGITLEHAALVMAGYTVLFGGILVWSFLRRDVS